MSTTKPTSDAPLKLPGAGRPPSLNQLAARMTINGQNGTPAATTSAPRPRLAASILRTGSAASVSTLASTTDSVAVNAPSTRSTSPSNLPGSPPRSTGTPTNDSGGQALTTEKVEKLNEETAAAPAEKKPPRGYKNIPSLDAITARLAKARALSIDGTPNPPEPELIEDPKTPGVTMKPQEHPLQFAWTIYHDSKSKYPYTPAPASAVPPSATPSNAGEFTPHPPESTDYEAGLTVVGEFDTVEQFCRYFNWLKPPSQLERNSNYHLFKSGIKPMWEDEANANGGKWVLTMKNNPALLDRCWNWLAMALVGEELEDGDEICGAVVSLRSKVDRIQVWTRSKDDVEKLNGIGKKLVKLLDVSEADSIGLEFQYNSDDRPPPNKFISIQSMPTTSYRSSFQTGSSTPGHGPTRSFGGGPGFGGDSPASAGPVIGGGAFGSFGVGIGAGTWKPRGK
ncbi:translation initiation factor eIF 4e-like domain-containing protein [Crucibulum laeve]|uniref:Translation initiation factor eIF 4e-like domain-containing protein n=1 Tax=Crucibulum laeve TaxID=68775 RepID=A0A5C3M1P8_9AGAR|nr:translation initiation factor eIF 4e-like domain-containing protein [Crucibulum laeve]